MKTFFLITTLAALTFSMTLHCGAAENIDLSLVLESPIRTLRLNQTTLLKLNIIGSNVYKIIEGTEGISTDNKRAEAFVYQFEFKPQRKGRFNFGPYNLSINGQELISNSVSVEVIPEWNGKYGTFFRVDKNSIVLGEDIELSVETWTKEHMARIIYLKRYDSVMLSKVGSGSYSSRTKKNETYRRQTWIITPKKAGEFKITQQLFSGIPEDTDQPDITITVKEPTQQEDEG